MNIVSVKIKNFLSLADVEIKPGKITQIVGDNGQGKTSILKALDFAVQGSNDPSLVKLGEDSAEVLLELSDNTLIRRRLNSQGRQSVDVSREGMKATSPQALLGALFDQSSFNPLELLDAKKRADAIMKSIEIKLDAPALAGMIGVAEKDLPPLDFGQHGLKVLEQCHKYYYARRAEANRDAKEKKTRWETYRSDFKPMDTPKMKRKEIELRRESCKTIVTQMQGHIDRVKAANERNKKAQEKVTRYEGEQAKVADDILTIERSIAAVDDEVQKQIELAKAEGQKKRAALSEQLTREKSRYEASKKFVDEAKSDVSDSLESDAEFAEEMAQAKLELSTLESEERMIEAFEATEKSREMIAGMEREFQTAEAFAEALDKRVVALDGSVKKDLMSSAEMPIDGLEYVDGQFLVNGVSVDNLSTAAAMKLAVAVARKLSKKAKVICIDGAEALDSKTWASFKKETKDDGFTYFVTKVGGAHEDGESVVIPMDKGQVNQ